MMSVQCEDIYTPFIFILLLSLNKNILDSWMNLIFKILILLAFIIKRNLIFMIQFQ